MVVARFVASRAVGLASSSARLLVATLLGAWLVSGCNALDPALLERLRSPIEMPPVDSGTDESPPETPCVATGFERCNALDDDCDEEIDENADVSCVALNAMTMCGSEGRCLTLGCKPGFLDCNERSDDGCEHPAADGPCDMCSGPSCGGMDAGPDAAPPEDAEVEDAADELDAEVDESDACVPQAEVCDGQDNDCNDQVDETAECALERCVDTAPSYRGEECDRCVCEKCGAYTDDCQDNPNATWAMQCRAVLECYVVEARAGNCNGADCYGVGGGPCAAEINLAAGGTSGTDTGPAIGGGCTATDPPTTACMAATNYRDHCTLDLCETECAQ